IHLKKKKRNPEEFDLDKLADATPDFSGAEIETAVVAAMYDAFDEGQELDTPRIQNSIGDIVPLSITMREVIEGMREWARTLAQSKRKAAQEAGAALIDSMQRKLEL